VAVQSAGQTPTFRLASYANLLVNLKKKSKPSINGATKAAVSDNKH